MLSASLNKTFPSFLHHFAIIMLKSIIKSLIKYVPFFSNYLCHYNTFRKFYFMFYDFEESFVIIGLNNIYSTDLIQWFYELL